MQWYMKSSWIANAMDQGFHRFVPELTTSETAVRAMLTSSANPLATAPDSVSPQRSRPKDASSGPTFCMQVGQLRSVNQQHEATGTTHPNDPATPDREWALVLGRPMQVNQYSTLMPTEADLAAWPWDYRQYLLARNELTP